MFLLSCQLSVAARNAHLAGCSDRGGAGVGGWLLHREDFIDYNCREDRKTKTTTRTKKDFGTVRFEDYKSEL
ncbi:MAG: hypothetical protein EOP50_10100 [Sphingobacteriales bacterium]|nr:MAG: hypothetical protein EOP50_10100 [Sphingobacteriales bacterium]